MRFKFQDIVFLRLSRTSAGFRLRRRISGRNGLQHHAVFYARWPRHPHHGVPEGMSAELLVGVTIPKTAARSSEVYRRERAAAAGSASIAARSRLSNAPRRESSRTPTAAATAVIASASARLRPASAPLEGGRFRAGAVHREDIPFYEQSGWGDLLGRRAPLPAGLSAGDARGMRQA